MSSTTDTVAIRGAFALIWAKDHWKALLAGTLGVVALGYLAYRRFHSR